MSLFFSERNVFGMSICILIIHPLAVLQAFLVRNQNEIPSKGFAYCLKIIEIVSHLLRKCDFLDYFPTSSNVWISAQIRWYKSKIYDLASSSEFFFYWKPKCEKSMTREEKAASPIDGGSRSISWKSSKKAAILRYGRLLLFDPLFKRILNVKGIFFHWLKPGGRKTQTLQTSMTN